MLLGGPKSDQAALSGGSWQPLLPLANLQDPRLRKVARSTDLALASTKFFIDLGGVETFRAIVAGPTNLRRSFGYRIRNYEDETYAAVGYDSGWITTATRIDYGTLPYGAPYWWDGLVPYPDTTRSGPSIIHIFDENVAARFWSIEIDADGNPDGFVDIGRLFMAGHYVPSLNYGYDRNSFSYADNTLRATTLNGASIERERVNPREFQFGLDLLPEAEAFGVLLPFVRETGFANEVFVIPDPDDATHMQDRSFFAKIRQMDALTQAMFGRASTGFQLREIF